MLLRRRPWRLEIKLNLLCLIFLILLSTLVLGCTTNSDPLIGKWQYKGDEEHSSYIYEFLSDGTFIVTSQSGYSESGTWERLSQNQFRTFSQGGEWKFNFIDKNCFVNEDWSSYKFCKI